MTLIKQLIIDLKKFFWLILYIHIYPFATIKLIVLCIRFYLKLLKSAHNTYEYVYCFSLISIGFTNNPLFYLFMVVYPLVFSFVVPNETIFVYLKILGYINIYLICQYKLTTFLLNYFEIKVDPRSFLSRKYPKKILLNVIESLYLFLRLKK